MANIIATFKNGAQVQFNFEASRGGQDHYSVLKHGRYTDEFVSVAEGSQPEVVFNQYFTFDNGQVPETEVKVDHNTVETLVTI